MTRITVTALFTTALAGCAAAPGTIPPETPGASARAAYAEARSVARSWSSDARLRWIDGEGIGPDGLALPERGVWSFHYTRPGTELELRIRIHSLETTSEERAPTSPPGHVLGNQALGTTWIDSPDVMTAVHAAANVPLDGPFALFLVPARPPVWRVESAAGRDWRVHAETAEVLAP